MLRFLKNFSTQPRQKLTFYVLKVWRTELLQCSKVLGAITPFEKGGRFALANRGDFKSP